MQKIKYTIAATSLASTFILGASMLVGPVLSYAAENKGSSQMEVVDGKYFKDIVSPQDSSTSLPLIGEKTTVESDMDKYVYIDVIAMKDFPKGSWHPQGNPGTIFQHAIFMDKDLKPFPKIDGKYYLKNTTEVKAGELLGKWAVLKEEDWVKGTKSITEYYYKLIDSQRLNKTSSYSFNLDSTVGVSQEEAFSIGQTLGLDFQVGYKHAFNLGGNGMWQTTRTIGSNLFQQSSIKREFNLPQAVFNYNHPYFWVGVYQGVTDYFVKPSTKLQEVLDAFNKSSLLGHQMEIKLQLPNIHSQKTSLFQTVRTKGSGNPEEVEQTQMGTE
ncbi:TPA: hypothetical protein ACQUHP_005293 [Bacillus cereus]